MPQFTPKPKVEVKDTLESKSNVHDVAEVGDSLLVQKSHNAKSTDVFEGLAKDAGWYISMYELDECGDKYVASPFTEGPSDGA